MRKSFGSSISDPVLSPTQNPVRSPIFHPHSESIFRRRRASSESALDISLSEAETEDVRHVFRGYYIHKHGPFITLLTICGLSIIALGWIFCTTSVSAPNQVLGLFSAVCSIGIGLTAVFYYRYVSREAWRFAESAVEAKIDNMSDLEDYYGQFR